MLTAKQQQTYQFICDYIARHDCAPTEAEIAAGIGIRSRGVVHRYVKALAAADKITIIPGRRRNIMPVEGHRRQGLPILGKIAAGQPMEVVLQQEQLCVEDLLAPGRFVLQVKGDSMIGDNICDGDYIICEKRRDVGRHDIVIALLDGQEVTLKRIHNNDNGTVTLIPSNPCLSPMVYQAKQVEIQGVYVGLLRCL